jgi:signal transduction histidine kinase
MKAVMEQKDCFMASMSHELRTPLNGIIGLAEGLIKGTYGPLSDAMRRQLHIIRMSGLRLLRIVNGIMDSSALRTGRLKIREDVVNVHTTCHDVMELTQHLIRSNVSIVNSVPRLCFIKGDGDRLVQIFYNLLGNAAKFTKAGEIRVMAEHLEKEGKWAISVSDTGIGIQAEKLHTIFDAFEQVRNTYS